MQQALKTPRPTYLEHLELLRRAQLALREQTAQEATVVLRCVAAR